MYLPASKALGDRSSAAEAAQAAEVASRKKQNLPCQRQVAAIKSCCSGGAAAQDDLQPLAQEQAAAAQ